MSFEDWRLMFPNAPSSRYYNGDDSASRRHKISLIVFAVTTLSTLFAAGVIYMRVRKVRPFVLKEMEERRLAKEALAVSYHHSFVGKLELTTICRALVTRILRTNTTRSSSAKLARPSRLDDRCSSPSARVPARESRSSPDEAEATPPTRPPLAFRLLRSRIYRCTRKRPRTTLGT